MQDPSRFVPLRRQAEALAGIALDRVHGQGAVEQALSIDTEAITAKGHEQVRLSRHAFDRIMPLAIGKAAVAMARGLQARLQAADIEACQPCVVTKHGHQDPSLSWPQLGAGHPIPDAAGAEAVRRLEAQLRDCTTSTLVICCLSGGASALLPAPVDGIGMADLQAATALMLGRSIGIEDINLLRRHCSRLAGGGMLRQAQPATVLTLAISDVIGDEPAAIGSGPTLPDPTSFQDLHAVLNEHVLLDTLPASIRQHVLRGCADQVPDTLKPADIDPSRWHWLRIAGLPEAMSAIVDAAQEQDLLLHRLPDPLTGAVDEVAPLLASILHGLPAGGGLLAGGECTVALPRQPGVGGRNSHLALLLAEGIQDQELGVLVFGTDGTDGPTSHAGAWVDGSTWRRARAIGLDPADHLRRFDSASLFAALGDCFDTGPTGTNVNDLVIGLRL